MTRSGGEPGAAAGRPCAWGDHEFTGRRVLESGRHPIMGPYLRFAARCARCGRETTETEWLDILSGRKRGADE